MNVMIGENDHAYQWLEDWTDVPSPDEAKVGWAHHGLAVTRSGDLVSFHAERPDVVIFDREGRVLRSFPTGLKEGHGITLVEEGNQEFVWIADPGVKRRKAPSGAYEADFASQQGQVVKFQLDGTVVSRLSRPPNPAYMTGRYAPTSVAVDEERLGGSGDIWVADGYGESLVHRYRKDGSYLETISGEEGAAGPFNCPHAVFIDRRHPEPELWVADRANARAQVYSLDGSWRRAVGEQFLDSPSVFASCGTNLVVGELYARLAVIDIEDELVCYLGNNGDVRSIPGWPNNLEGEDRLVRPRHLEPGRFNSPHGLAIDADGSIYVAEWLIGGRMIKLTKVAT